MNPECPKDSYESRIDARGLESVEIGSIVGAGGFTWYGGEESFVLHGDGWGSIEVGEYDGGWIYTDSFGFRVRCAEPGPGLLGFESRAGRESYCKFGTTRI